MKKKRTILRFETDPIAVLRFLDDHAPGHNVEPEDVNTGTLIIRAERGTETLGYVWGQWLDHEIMWVHAASKSPLWLSQDIYDRHLDIFRFFGVRYIACEPIGPKSPATRKVLLARGWQQDGDELYLRLDDGQKEEAEDSEGAAAATTPGPTPSG